MYSKCNTSLEFVPLSVKLQNEHRHVMVRTEAMYSGGPGSETMFRERFL